MKYRADIVSLHSIELATWQILMLPVGVGAFFGTLALCVFQALRERANAQAN
jgi:hypothetical protein